MSFPFYRILILKVMTATERRKSSDSYGRTGYMAELVICQSWTEGLVHFCAD